LNTECESGNREAEERRETENKQGASKDQTGKGFLKKKKKGKP